jgi:hypothetical protein
MKVVIKDTLKNRRMLQKWHVTFDDEMFRSKGFEVISTFQKSKVDYKHEYKKDIMKEVYTIRCKKYSISWNIPDTVCFDKKEMIEEILK